MSQADFETRIRAMLVLLRRQVGLSVQQQTIDKYLALVSPSLAHGLGETRLPIAPGKAGFLKRNSYPLLCQMLSNLLTAYWVLCDGPEHESGDNASVVEVLLEKLESIVADGLHKYAICPVQPVGFELRNREADLQAKREQVRFDDLSEQCVGAGVPIMPYDDADILEHKLAARMSELVEAEPGNLPDQPLPDEGSIVVPPTFKGVPVVFVESLEPAPGAEDIVTE